MLNSVRKIPFRNTASMCKRSFAEMVGDDAYVADLSSNRRVTVKNVYFQYIILVQWNCIN